MSAEPTRRRPYAARMSAEERRTQLLDAALAVIAREGYGSLTVEAIAHEAGVTRPVVYGVFDDLHDLLRQLLERQQQIASRRVLAALPDRLDDGDLADVTGGITRRLAAMVRDDPTTWGPILATAHGTPRTVHERIAASREEVASVLSGLLESLTTAGPLGGADPDLLAGALIVVMEENGRRLLDDPDDALVERLVSTVQAVARAIAPGPSS